MGSQSFAKQISAGSIGPTGTIGSTGPIGATGIQGITGATGTIGSTGPTGSIGATGIQGITGATGTIGATGPTGPMGATGTIGATGSTGSIGATGPGAVMSIYGYQYGGSGTIGSPATGAYLQVPFNASGPFSNTTTSGNTFTITQAGTVFVMGSVSVSVTPGWLILAILQNGIVVATSSNRAFNNETPPEPNNVVVQGIFNANAGDTFSLSVANLGAGGVQMISRGSQFTVQSIGGVQGVQGATGIQGITGATGTIGNTGTVGPTGSIGATGSTGSIGSTGPTGPMGATGIQGIQGATGPASLPTMFAYNNGISLMPFLNINLLPGIIGTTGPSLNELSLGMTGMTMLAFQNGGSPIMAYGSISLNNNLIGTTGANGLLNISATGIPTGISIQNNGVAVGSSNEFSTLNLQGGLQGTSNGTIVNITPFNNFIQLTATGGNINRLQQQQVQWGGAQISVGAMGITTIGTACAFAVIPFANSPNNYAYYDVHAAVAFTGIPSGSYTVGMQQWLNATGAYGSGTPVAQSLAYVPVNNSGNSGTTSGISFGQIQTNYTVAIGSGANVSTWLSYMYPGGVGTGISISPTGSRFQLRQLG